MSNLNIAKWVALGHSAIRDVWAGNLEEEFVAIRNAVITCPYIAMDTEFPGIVARPIGNFRTTHELYYQTLRCNVNILKIIQLGITLCDEHGNPPAKGPSTWQFNFRFCLSEDTYAQDSIDLLTGSGINFERFEREGVDIALFAQLMITSGLVLTPGVQWLSFHSGYDFGYIMKNLTNQDLPEKESEFFEILRLFFPSIYDIKYILKECDMISHSIGLDALTDQLGVKRIGPAHQAGSDSLMTALCFFKLVSDHFRGETPTHTNGILYGLGEDNAGGNTPITGGTPVSTNTPLNPNSPAFPSAPHTSTTRSSGGSGSAYINSVVYHGMAPPNRTVNGQK